MNVQQAIKELEAGNTLRSGSSLVKRRDETILVSTGSWTARLSLPDFVALWGSRDFVPHNAPASIDEEADRQYYGKLRSRQ